MKKIFILIVLLITTITAFSQNDDTKNSDVGRISIVAWVPEQIEGMPAAARANLSNKLSQIITKNGFGGTALDNRFILTANITVLTKDVTPTAPPMQAYTLEVTLYIGDGIDGTLFSTTSTTLKGVGETEQKAYMAALKNLKTTDPKYTDFIEKGKTRIIEYYNSKCDFIIKAAQSLADQNKYEEGIAKLVAIPDACTECYNKATEAVKVLYQQYIDHECAINLQKAMTIWNAGQDIDAAREVIPILMNIDPKSSCQAKVKEFENSIAKRVKELDEREWNTMQTQLTREYNLEKQSIEAARAIGVAYGNNQPDVEYNILWW